MIPTIDDPRASAISSTGGHPAQRPQLRKNFCSRSLRGCFLSSSKLGSRNRP